MKPHLEEAWRSLRLADRDIKAFDILRADPEAHLSIVCFHAQQAVEKSLKAVLSCTRLGSSARTIWSGWRDCLAPRASWCPATKMNCAG